MRQERTVQGSIFDLFAEHEIGRELEAMSQWLDAHRDLLNLVTSDLRRQGVTETGRQGLPSEAVLRCALLKQYRQLSLYEERQCGIFVRVTFLLSVGCCGIHGLSPIARRGSLPSQIQLIYGRCSRQRNQHPACGGQGLRRTRPFYQATFEAILN